MLTITIQKTPVAITIAARRESPATRLFDRMPLPKPRVRSLTFSRKELGLVAANPFQRKVCRIR